MRAVRECGDENKTAGRGAGQRGWYEWIAPMITGESVLDAGCGLGYGLDILGASAREVRGQDVDPQLASPRVQIRRLDTFPDSSFDVVVSVDVIEHIQDDRAFVNQLARVARRQVIMTTPNWTAGRCTWPYHVREYTPDQLRKLCEPFGTVHMWKGTPDGSEVYPIVHPLMNGVFNALRATPGASPFARGINFALPSRARIHSHIAVAIDTSRR